MNHLIVIIIVLFITTIHSDLVVYSFGKETHFTCVSIGFPRDKSQESFTIVGNITVPYPANACSSINGDISGKVALVTSGDCFPSEKARNLQNAKASFTIFSSFSLQLGDTKYVTSDLKENDIFIRGVEILEIDFNTLLSIFHSDPNAFLHATPDENIVSIYYESNYWIFVSVIFGIPNVILLFFSIYRGFGFFYKKKSRIALLSYIFIFIGCVFRILSLIDPTGGRFIWWFAAKTSIVSNPLSIGLCTCISTSFHWIAVFDEKKLTSYVTVLSRYKIHTAVTVTLIFIFGIADTIMRASLIHQPIVTMISSAFYGIVSIVIFGFFSFCCFKLRQFINKRRPDQIDPKITPTSSSTVKTVTRLYILGIIQCVILFCYFVIGAATSFQIPGPLLYSILVTFVIFCSTAIDWAQSLMFKDAFSENSSQESTPSITFDSTAYIKSNSESKYQLQTILPSLDTPNSTNSIIIV